MTTCPNCAATLNDYQPCAMCEFHHQELLERLNGGGDGAAGLQVIAGWAMFGYRKPPCAAWGSTRDSHHSTSQPAPQPGF